MIIVDYIRNKNMKSKERRSIINKRYMWIIRRVKGGCRVIKGKEGRIRRV